MTYLVCAPSRLVRLGLGLGLCVALAACSASDPPSGGVGEDSGGGGADVGGEDTALVEDSGPPDTGPPPDTGVEADTAPTERRAFGEPCRANPDCESGFCISSPLGFVCTSPCGGDDDCPALGGSAMRCRETENFGVDGTLICAPTDSTLCQPCFQDDNCFGGLCASAPNGSVCGLDCETDADCPDGATCFIFSPSGDRLAIPQCLPTNLSCGCTEETAGETRTCVQTSVRGERCFGEETCDPVRGWVGCDAPDPFPEACDGVDNDCNGAIDDGLASTQMCEETNAFGTCQGFAVCEGEAGYVCRAPEPAAEACDLLDNDCDGDIDEDFRDEQGVLNTSAHCGVCGNNCAERFDLAAETACDVDEQGQASCVITACLPGYALAGPTTCLPLASSLCQPCTGDDECNPEVGDRCIAYPGGQTFCGRSCAENSPFGINCPTGYICTDEGQCQLEAGTCLCGEGDSFIRPCAIPDPNDPANNCVGTLTCDRGELSACVPPEDACNGFDDDCDGVIDNGLRDPDSGAYISDNHCGRCFNDCVLRFSDPMFHANGICDGLEAVQRDETPACALVCDQGWRDVNGLVDDGCECEVIDAVTDPPDLMGLDVNCDGIDGEVARGIFVSRTGDDNNPGTIESPVRRIQRAIDLAGEGRDHVYVAAGVYTETVTLRAGVSVYGGYSFDYRRRDIAGNETAIFGSNPDGTVIANGVIGAQTEFSGFTVVGADNDAISGSSYAIYASESDGALVLTYNTVRGGAGGPGSRGGSGLEGVHAPMGDVSQGQPQRISTTPICTGGAANQSNGSAGTQHTCSDESGSMFSTGGGGGGAADCPIYNQAEGSGTSGAGPGAGAGGAGGYNQRLELLFPGSTQCVCLVPSVLNSTEVGVPGRDGTTGAGGTAGQGCAETPGRVVDGRWVAGPARANPNQLSQPDSGSGGKGIKGNAGGGGGGGGAGSGLQHGPDVACNAFGNEAIGGGGGGGGAGGCGGDGGLGGQPGGGSFAIFVTFAQAPLSLPRIEGNTIERGVGGTGGDGGAGGTGGLGSAGKGAQALTEAQLVALLACSDPGGRGGDGGNGGAGGGGGGGCGGISAGIYVGGQESLPMYRDANSFSAIGRAGEGGRGGPSNGNDGGDGNDGLYVEVVP